MTTPFVSVLGDELAAVGQELEKLKVAEEAIRAEVAERLRGISEERSRLEARARHIQALLALDGQGGGQATGDDNQAGANSGAWLHATGISLAEAAHQVLLEVGRELHYKDLAAQLQVRGVNIPGRDPPINLVAHIHNDPRFIRPKRGVYGLREWYPKGMKSVGRRTRRGGRRTGQRGSSK